MAGNGRSLPGWSSVAGKPDPLAVAKGATELGWGGLMLAEVERKLPIAERPAPLPIRERPSPCGTVSSR